MPIPLFSIFVRMLHLILGIGTPQQFPPPLPAAEENALFRRAEMGDEDARQKLILHNLRLVSHIVRKYYSTAPSPEDLVSIGTIGLVKAVDSFHVENGAKFATYAAKCIQNAILS
ncbi:MAG: sigma-70 family RNA polymerase sigma factor [Ruminococcaceae bacterium]|nr:sigma-70 family RNA polymerase sigma factor [Oscillospiraceae bacterium]